MVYHGLGRNRSGKTFLPHDLGESAVGISRNMLVKAELPVADSQSMQSIDIHLAEMTGCRALLVKAQFVARTELHPMLEEYLVRLLFRAVRLGRVEAVEKTSPMVSAPRQPSDLHAIGDHCLLHCGLFPEQALASDLPLSYFVKVGIAAYEDYSHYVDDPVFSMLASSFVDMMDLLQTVREIDHDDISIDPLSAYHLWRDTGSQRALEMLRRHTPALPSYHNSLSIN